LQAIEDWAISEAKQALAVVKELTGRNIKWTEVWRAAALAPALVDIGIELETTRNGNPSIHKELLSSIKHPVAEALERARKMNKIVTTFAASVREHAVNGRIHTTFNQLRTTKDDDDDS